MAVHPVRYTDTITQWDGTVVTVNLRKEGHAGSTPGLNFAGPDPVVRQDSEPESDLLTPLRPTLATVYLTNASSAVLDEIYADSTEWQLEIILDGTRDFIGPIIREPLGRSRDQFAQEPFAITASCGMGTLQQMPLFEQFLNDGLLAGASKTRAGWFIYFLDLVGLGLDYYMASRWYALNMVTGDPLVQEYIRAEAWTFDADLNRSCFDVLEELAASLGMVIHQKGGYWHIYQRELFFADSFTRYAYSSGTNPTSSGTSDTYTANTTVSSVSGNAAGSILSSRDPFALVPIKYIHQSVTSLLPNSDFRVLEYSGGTYTPTAADRWTAGHASAGSAPTLDGYMVAETANGQPTVTRVFNFDVNHAAASATVAFIKSAAAGGQYLETESPIQLETSGFESLRLKIRCMGVYTQSAAEDDKTVPYSVTAFIRVAYTVGATTYYAKRDIPGAGIAATWTTDSSDRIRVDVTGNEETEVQVEIPDFPADDGTIAVRFEQPQARTDATYSGGVRPFLQFLLGALRLVPVITASGATQIATEYQVGISGVTGTRRDRLEFLTGTGPTVANKGATLLSDNTLANDWGIGVQTVASNLTLHEFLGEQILEQVRNPQDEIEGTYTGLRLSPINAVKVGGVPYLPVHSTYSYRWNRTEVNAVAVQLDGFTSSITQLSDDRVSSMVAGSNEGTARMQAFLSDYAQGFSISNALTLTNGNLTGVITSIPISPTLSAELAALADGEYVAIAGLNGGFWEFQLNGSQVAPITALTVVSQDIGDEIIPDGSGVFPGTGALVSIQTQTRNAIFSLVSSSGGFTTLTSDVNGAAITALPVAATPTGFDLFDGDLLRVVSSHEDYLGQSFPVSVNGDQAAPDTSIAINSTEVRALSGDPVLLSEVILQTTVLQNAAEIQINATSISTNAGNISTNTANITINANQISLNVTEISTNRGDITTNTGNITVNANGIAANVTSITTNAGNISTNTSNISANASQISLNVTSISGNATDIANAELDILTNAGNITTNSSNITINANGISANTTSISTNAGNISTNTSSISTNAGNISLNVTSISTNAGNIATNTSNISVNAGNIALKVDANGVIAAINVSPEVITISAGKIAIDGTTTFSAGYDPSGKIESGGAAADVNANATTISGGKITTGSITATQIAAGTITALEIATNTITAAKISAGTITTTEIAANTITASNIAAGTITATEIAAGTITASNIAAGTITATELATNSVTADEINVASLAAVSSNMGSVTVSTGGGISSTGGTYSWSLQYGTGLSVTTASTSTTVNAATVSVVNTTSGSVSGSLTATPAASILLVDIATIATSATIGGSAILTAASSLDATNLTNVGSGLQIAGGALKIDAQVAAGTGGYTGDTDTLTLVTDDGTTVLILCEAV